MRVIPSAATCHSERSEESKQVAHDPSRGSGGPCRMVTGHWYYSLSHVQHASLSFTQPLTSPLALLHQCEIHLARRDGRVPRLAPLAPSSDRHSRFGEPQRHREHSGTHVRMVQAARLTLLIPMTIDDAACVSFRAQRLVIPSAARNLSRSRTTPRAARGDHAGWSQVIGSMCGLAQTPTHENFSQLRKAEMYFRRLWLTRTPTYEKSSQPRRRVIIVASGGQRSRSGAPPSPRDT
ncbi:MAG: hypothetical protein KatS3mg058_0849 [Roseiflexus sp.]|nr:MAG: hypothetical protein KatS3mg058_0849 [Roseiflexus sp.]